MSGKRERQPTIIDVARIAGVSKTTVARVLADGPHVTPETRAAVEAAVRATGYQRNRLALGLRTGRSSTLGLVIPDISNTFWADVARGAQDKAEEDGRSLLIFSSDWDVDRERRHLLALRQSRVDGIIISPVTDDSDVLHQTGTPVVVVGSSGERFPELNGVRCDIAQGVGLALDHLVGNGHRRPGLILGTSRRAARARFFEAVAAHCATRDIDAADLPVEEAEYTVETGRAAMRRLLQRHGTRLTAVFAANDLMALGALLAVREAGLSCPRDISIVGVDGISACAFADPGLTTVEKPRYEYGAMAAALLLAELAGAPAREHKVLPCRLTERGSVTARRPGPTEP